ncbi:hypothetical protein H310_07207 [Aphanomyces invadans]|uniref:Uncharacterized protein n=1 Tax=Aphanomyces invadans TaxID=157072 RepID=A0A024U4T3_9STRA|nr:hypothetical protein H310_07207 [Aphanomyces invadans]ETW00638.1 hypothetical protein H310_07207 [Aphanomyces invadans]|eukprot:XP_008870773.1 hypothetical protein H310_07207 [Aphanomyces invadans]
MRALVVTTMLGRQQCELNVSKVHWNNNDVDEERTNEMIPTIFGVKIVPNCTVHPPSAEPSHEYPFTSMKFLQQSKIWPGDRSTYRNTTNMPSMSSWCREWCRPSSSKTAEAQ